MSRPESIGQGHRVIVQLQGEVSHLRNQLNMMKKEKMDVDKMKKRLKYFETKYPHPYEDEL